MVRRQATIPRLPNLHALKFVYFADMPDSWDFARDGRQQPTPVVWEQQAKKQLALLSRELPKMQGSQLDSIDAEANRLLHELVGGHRGRHRKMYLPQVLRLVRKETSRRASELKRKNLPALTNLGSLPQPVRHHIQSAGLTDMQEKCYILKVAHVWTDRQIGVALGIHHKTVQEHLARAKRKVESESARKTYHKRES